MLNKVLRLWSRRAALVTVLVLLGGPFAECQGWLATAEARMACCANEQECPMHRSDRQQSGSSQKVSQSDADQCCAASEHGDSLPSSAKVTASLDNLAFIPSLLPVTVVMPVSRADEAYDSTASPPTRRSRHVLLSVFLI